jgi:dihydroflavonol-4-reductase
MKVFVAGATGFIGKNAVKRLIESGHECICLVRVTSKKEVLETIGCQFVTGDITDKDSLIEGMKGCEAVINLANLYSYWEPDVSLYEKINIDGTRNVMESALASGMKKIVHVSSLVTWGRTSDVPFNEKSPIGEHTSEYARTKYEGDKVAWELYETKGLPLVMIYPCGVLGADDPKSSGNHVKLLINRKMPIRGLESSVITYVHVKDVAEAIVRALEKDGNIGEGYIIGKEQLSLGQLNKLVSEISGVPLPFLSVPNIMAKFNAFFLTALANATKRPPVWGLSTDLVRNLLTGFRADGSKAERELGISYTPVRQAVEECIESLQSKQNA